MLRSLAPCCLLLSLSVACGGAAPAPEGKDDLHTPERLYPLAQGYVWTYDVDTGTGLPTLAITRVTAADGSRFEVSSGSDPLVYERRPEGVYRPQRDGWLLRAPVKAGATWPAGAGMQAEVTDVAKAVSTPAGDFTDCVEVRESGAGGDKQIRTVYCPDVGPVVVESSMAMQLSGQAAKVLGTLRGYLLDGQAH
jgi:hypothetical protein